MKKPRIQDKLKILLSILFFTNKKKYNNMYNKILISVLPINTRRRTITNTSKKNVSDDNTIVSATELRYWMKAEDSRM